MQDSQPEAGAKIAGIREEVRRIAQRDDRRSAAGCAATVTPVRRCVAHP